MPHSQSNDQAHHAFTAQRRARAIELRMGGATYAKIAEQLGYSDRAAAFMDIKRALEVSLREMHERVELYRTEHILRIERLLLACWPTALQGDEGAIDTARRLLVELAKVTGVNEPTRVDVITHDAVDLKIAQLTAELGLQGGPAGEASAPAAPATPED